MNYPFADAEWLTKYLPKTTLYRRVKVGFLTLGHLRTAEAVGVRFFTGDNASSIDWGILITIAQEDWRKALKRASNPSLLWAWKRDRNTPKNADELGACINWWKSQNYFPARTLVKAEERDFLDELAQKAVNRASTAIERLAMTITRIQGWQTLSNCKSVWDIPMVCATHLIMASSELDGNFHIPYDLIMRAKNGRG